MKKATLTMLACCMAIGGFSQLDFAITGGGISRDELRKLIVEDIDGDGNEDVYCIGTATGSGSFAGNNYITLGTNNMWETTLSTSVGQCKYWLMSQISGNYLRGYDAYYNETDPDFYYGHIGAFSGSIFVGGTQLNSQGIEDIAVVIRDNSGQQSLAFSLGGTDQDVPAGISGSGDNLWIGGNFKGTTDIDPTTNTENLTSAGDQDAYVVVCEKWGSEYVPGSYVHASGQKQDVIMDLFGSAKIYEDLLVTLGRFEETTEITTFPIPGTNAVITIGGGDRGGFLVRSKADLSNPEVAVIKCDEDVEPQALGVVHDGVDAIYSVGYHNGTSLEVSDLVSFGDSPTYSHGPVACDGTRNMFITRHNADGTVGFVHNIGGSINDEAKAVAVFNGGIAITGSFMGTVDFDPGPDVFNLTSNGDKDAFVLALDLDGNFVNAFNIGGPGTDIGHTIAVDDQNNVYVGGSHRDAVDFSLGNNTAVKTSAGQEDIFIAKYGGVITGLPTVASPIAGMEVFPNPASDQIQVRFGAPVIGKGRIVLTDMAGRIALSQELLAQPSNEVDLAGLPAGIYLLEVQLGEERVTRKVVKQG